MIYTRGHLDVLTQAPPGELVQFANRVYRFSHCSFCDRVMGGVPGAQYVQMSSSGGLVKRQICAECFDGPEGVL